MVGEIEPCGVRFASGDTFLTCPVTVLLCNYFILSHFESMSCQISICVDYFVTWINIKWYRIKDKKDRTGPEIKPSTHKRIFRSYPVWWFLRCILYPRDFEYIYHIGNMMTSSNGTIFRVTGHLCGEFTSHRWIPHTKASDAELWCCLWSAPE